MFEKYKGKPVSQYINKKMLPINEIHFDQVDEFNRIYLYCKKHYQRVDPTPSKGISIKASEKYHERYCFITGNQRYELIVICRSGCYRFILKNKRAEDNIVKGTTSVREIYKEADSLGIDLSKYMSTPEEGKNIKECIEPPHIEILMPLLTGKPIEHVYHMDLNSSYASRVVEQFPELKVLFVSLYTKRKDNNNYFKHVLTNAIGCMQSEFCPDYKVRFHTSKYQFAKLSMAAINGTRALIEHYIEKLRKNGFVPLLSNTDGIWYYSAKGRPFHDKNEGKALGCWKTDYEDVILLYKSVGAYQFKCPDGHVETRLRGICKYDAVNPDRSTWEFGDIMKSGDTCLWSFDEEKGVYKVWLSEL